MSTRKGDRSSPSSPESQALPQVPGDEETKAQGSVEVTALPRKETVREPELSAALRLFEALRPLIHPQESPGEQAHRHTLEREREERQAEAARRQDERLAAAERYRQQRELRNWLLATVVLILAGVGCTAAILSADPGLRKEGIDLLKLIVVAVIAYLWGRSGGRDER
jgi:hypothetical protein